MARSIFSEYHLVQLEQRSAVVAPVVVAFVVVVAAVAFVVVGVAGLDFLQRTSLPLSGVDPV